MNEKGIITLKVGNSIDIIIEITKNKATLKAFINLYTIGNEAPFSQKICLMKDEQKGPNEYGLSATDNLYRLIEKEENENYYEVTYADGTKEYYYYLNENRYICYETNVILQEEIIPNGFSFIDQNNNILFYDETSVFPLTYATNHNITYEITTGNNRISKVTDNLNRVVNYLVDTEFITQQIIVKKVDFNKEIITFTYTENGYLETININKNFTEYESYTLSLGNEYWTFLDNRSKKCYKFKFDSNNNVLYFTEGFNGVYQDEETDTHKVEIIHENNITLIKRQNGKYAGYLFNEEGYINYEFDSLGNISKKEFVEINKKAKIIEESKIVVSLKSIANNYNIIQNGYFDEGTTNWTLLNSQDGSYTIQTIENNTFTPFIGNNVLKFSTDTSTSHKITQTIEKTFNKNKSFIFMFFAKMEQLGSVSIKLHPYYNETLISNETKTFIIANNETFDWKPFIEQISFSTIINKIIITIDISNTSILYLGAFKLTEENYGNYYNYDSNTGQVIQTTSSDGTISYYKYSDNKIINLVSKRTGSINIEYNENNLPSKTFSSSGLEIENTYDQNNFLTNQKTSYKTNNKTYYLLSTTNYTNGQITGVVDCNNYSINFTYDYTYEHLTKIDYPTYDDVITYNDTKITDTFTDNTTSYVIDNDITANDKISYLKNNNIEYNYTYDDNLNLTNIKLNNTPFEQFTYIKNPYNQSYLVNSKSILGATYNYIYDANYNLSTISIGTTLLFTINYDELERVTSIVNSEVSRETTYTYDINNRVEKITSPTYEEEYFYDNDKLIFKQVINGSVPSYIFESLDSVSSKTEAYETISKIKKESPYYIGFFDAVNPKLSSNSIYYLTKNYYSDEEALISAIFMSNTQDQLYVSNATIDNIPCLKFTPENENGSQITYEYTNSSLTEGSIGFYFKSKGTTNKSVLIEIELGNYALLRFILTKIDDLYESLICNVIKLDSSKNETLSNQFTINTKIEKNKWNFLSISYKKEGSILKLLFNLNEKIVSGQATNMTNALLGGFIKYIFGKYWYNSDNLQDNYNGYISGIIASPYSLITTSYIREYYLKTIPLFRGISLNDDSIYKVQSRYIYSSNFSNVNWISLKNSLITNQKEFPISEEIKVNFTYDGNSKKVVLPCFGNKIIYQTNLIDTGFVMCKTKFIETNERQVVFCLFNDDTHCLILYRNENNKLCFEYNYEIIESDLEVSNNSYSFIGFSWSKDETSETIYNLTIYASSNTFTTTFDLGDTTFNSEFRLYLGSQLEEGLETDIFGNNYINTYPLIGYMEDVIYTDLIPSALTDYTSKLSPVIEDEYIDKFGRLNTSLINGQIYLERGITYKTISTVGNNIRTSNLISSEYVNDWNFSYGYDSHGRIIGWQKNNLRNNINATFEYTYNNFDQLKSYTNPSNETIYYDYDSNGNITRVYNDTGDIHTYTYDTTTNCKLINFDEYTINYSNLYPTTITKNGTVVTRFSFRGNRLYQYINSERSTGTINYRYDINGQRILKSSSSDVVNYYYDSNNRLIKEVHKTYILIFNYDKNGRLYSLERRNKGYVLQKIYYYILNAFNDVVGLIYNNSLAAEYTYDAYGNITSSNSPINDDILILNPFRFRSYYYDNESGYYYCNSRYFIPLWGRWLTPDNYQYLTSTHHSGINLYCYCYNDPVNKFDPNGNMGLGIFLLLLFVASAVDDIKKIVTGEVSASASKDGSEVRINNSYKINNPLVQFGYAFYLNHINEETRDIIQGSTFGVQYEWQLHNIAYAYYSLIGDENIKSAASVDVGATIFDDNAHGEMSTIMHTLYMSKGLLIWAIDKIIDANLKERKK